MHKKNKAINLGVYAELKSGDGAKRMTPSQGELHSPVQENKNLAFLLVSIVATCPGISGTVPNFLPVSRKGPENLL